jgi:hypothetical protein
LAPLLILFACLAIAGCGGGGAGSHPSIEVVERYYEAFTADDMNALMDTVAPDDRNKTGLGLVSLLESLSFS